MRIAFVALDDMLVEWMVNGLKELEGCDTFVFFLNRMPATEQIFLKEIKACDPNVIVYAGPAGGPHAPTTRVFRGLREIAPSVLLCFDGSDVGWHGLLAEYRKAECFDLIVNCDGADWPKTDRDLTLWCPVGRTGFLNRPHVVRPIAFGFCGGHRSEPRRSIVDHLVRTAGLVVKPRDDKYGTYGAYTDFLGDCRIVLNIAYSAGGPHGQDPMTKQFKARIVECGFAGTCVLETRGSAAADWLTPGADFLTYETKEEAEWIVRHADPDYVRCVAMNLHSRVTNEYGPQRFWSRVFERLA